MSLPRGSRPQRSLRGQLRRASRQGRLPLGSLNEEAAYAAGLHSNSVPSVQMACIITASLRATAT